MPLFPRLIDTHCHIHFSAYDADREAVMERARNAGVAMITVGTDRQTSAGAVNLATREDGVWATVGLHPNHLFPYPHDSAEESESVVEQFDPEIYRTMAENPRVVAIGECGLDFYRIPHELDAATVRGKQQSVFHGQLDLADELELPVVIHCRDAHTEAYQILKEFVSNSKLARQGVIHCFTGTAIEARAYLELGFYISFTGTITFPPRKGGGDVVGEVVNAVPLERLLIETDAPYLTPAPFRGKRNEPARLQMVAEKIAEIKGIMLREVAEMTTANAKHLFRLT